MFNFSWESKTMKRTLVSLALFGAFASAAHGQSNVQVFGLVDQYLDFGSNGKQTVNRMQSGGIQGSRIGFRGTEDLGGGLNALFMLENGFNADDGSIGQGGLLFGRQAYVGVNGAYGTVTLGRHYTPFFWSLVTYGLGAGMAWGNASNYFQDLSVLRANNSINYVSPNLNGFTLRVLHALGESTTPGQNRVGDQSSVYGQYDRGPFSAGVSYLSRKTTVANTDTWTSLGASYDFKVAKAALLYQIRRDDANANRNNYWELNATVPLGSGSLLLDYGRFSNKIMDNADATAISVRYDYYLSKRTTLYGGVAHISNDANAKIGIAGATGTGLAAVAGDDPRSIVLGVRHIF